LPNLRKEYGNGVLIWDHYKGVKSFIEIEREQEKNVLRIDNTSSLSALLNLIIETNKVDSRIINIAFIKTISNINALELAYNLKNCTIIFLRWKNEINSKLSVRKMPYRSFKL
jgi:hypothetical protein